MWMTTRAPQHRFIIAILFCSSITIAAQQATEGKVADAAGKVAPVSTVTGHVYLDDTKGPCHKASVFLQPAALQENDTPPKRGIDHEKGPVTATVEAQFDGSFLFTHVAPGFYYVMATCPGYVSPLVALSLAEGRSRDEEREPLGPEQKKAKEQILESLGKVDVQSGLPASADVTLERGGAISGNISYDDGSPAAGLRVTVLARLPIGGKEAWAEVYFSGQSSILDMHQSDDRGNYRVSGLPPGKYAIEAVLQFDNTKSFISSSGSSTYSSNARSTHLEIYSGNTPSRKDAHGFTLQAREERTGEDIVLPVSKLHTIRGYIVSAKDGHVVNSGGLILYNASDHSIAGGQGLTEDDPSFTFSFIFEGDYVLTVAQSADVDYVPDLRTQNNLAPQHFIEHPLHRYGFASRPLHVDGDMDGLTIAVPEPTAREAQMFKGAMRQEEQENRTTAPQ